MHVGYTETFTQTATSGAPL